MNSRYLDRPCLIWWYWFIIVFLINWISVSLPCLFLSYHGVSHCFLALLLISFLIFPCCLTAVLVRNRLWYLEYFDCLFICLSVCLFLCPSVYLYVCLFLCLSLMNRLSYLEYCDALEKNIVIIHPIKSNLNNHFIFIKVSTLLIFFFIFYRNREKF